MHGLQLKIIIRMLWTRVWLLHGDSIPQTSCKAMSGQNNHILGWNAYVAPARNESLCMYVCIHLFKSGISFGLHVQSIVLTVKSGSAMWQGDILMFCVFWRTGMQRFSEKKQFSGFPNPHVGLVQKH